MAWELFELTAKMVLDTTGFYAELKAAEAALEKFNTGKSSGLGSGGSSGLGDALGKAAEVATSTASSWAGKAKDVVSTVNDVWDLGEHVGSLFSGKEEDTADAVQTVLDTFKEDVSGMAAEWQKGAQTLADGWATETGTLSSKWDGLGDSLLAALKDGLKDVAGDIAEDVAATLVKGLVDQVAEAITPAENPASTEPGNTLDAWDAARKGNGDWLQQMLATPILPENWQSDIIRSAITPNIFDKAWGYASGDGSTSRFDLYDAMGRSAAEQFIQAVNSHEGEITKEVVAEWVADAFPDLQSQLDAAGLTAPVKPYLTDVPLPDFTPNAKGLSYVPYDGYLAELHRGESVLNRVEAADWRGVQRSAPAASAEDIAAAVTRAVESSMNKIMIQLDGRSVGRAITPYVSREQAAETWSRR